MTTVSTVHRATMLRLTSFFSFKWLSEKFPSTAKVQPKQATFANCMERNKAGIRHIFAEVRQQSGFLQTALKNKKLNRDQICRHLDDIATLADLGETYLNDRGRIEKRFSDLKCGYPATCPSKIGVKNPGK